MLTIALEEVAYKLHPEVGDAGTKISSDRVIPEAPPSSPESPPPSLRRPNSPPPPPPHYRPKAESSRETTWRNVDLFACDFPKKFFQAGQGRAGGLADTVILAGAHRPGSEPSSGQLQT